MNARIEEPPDRSRRPKHFMRRFRLRPNRNALGLVAILIAMWYAAASQSNSAVYLLGFVLASLATVSIVHAWVNVYGVALSAEPIAPVFLGEDIGIPLVGTARRRRRHGHPGLRVTSATCHQPAPFDEIRFESPQRSLLWMRAEERGRFETIEVELSTIYPMGFITAIRPDELVQLHFVYPKPDGNLPLPQSQAPSKHLPDGVRSDGDDFSGTRAYRQGESQRHIDWKAAARGQPLLVKQWAGDTDDVIRLDWHTLGALPWEARLSQLTRWVIQAEQSGATYSLTLPRLTQSSTESSGSSMIRPDHGPAHFHECLRALAAFPPSLTERAEPLPPRSEPVPLPRANDSRNPHSVVRTDSLAAICLGLFLGVVPLLDRMPPVATAMFFAALITRLWINVKGTRLPSMPIKLVLLGGGLGLIGLIYGSMVGIEPGLGILFVLLSLKLLETNTIHDFQVLAMLGWFVALCGLFFSQDLRSWLYVGTVGLILTAALIRFHRGPGSAENPLKKGGRFKGA
ncbi:MAG: hypothetical protein JWL90_2845, partial [Chthoniobacteraceae bacterium]|nr:hypothetical protein [Chthoniobacteraceae bacterium]